MTNKEVLLNQEESFPSKKDKSSFWKKSLLLKQTLIATWKTKLQLVILLLLSAFTTSLVTGSWISYQRILQGEKTLQLSDANFDAVLSTNYSNIVHPVTQIANQAFSLRLGRIYYQKSDGNATALYFDNTIIGQEIKALNTADLKIIYIKDSDRIIGISDFQWTNASHPLNFNLNNINVKGSLYGQLISKAENTNNQILKTNYLQAAADLYNNLFVNVTADQILSSLKTYFIDWIAKYKDDNILLKSDDEFTNFLLMNKINYRSVSDANDDLRIPDEVNLAEDANVLTTKLLKENDSDPRLTEKEKLGMNGQWMRIYRKFDINAEELDVNIIKDFVNEYSSPSNYNSVTDYDEPNIYSVYFAQAAAALQNRKVNVVNQFVASAGVTDTGKNIDVKVVDLGLEKNYNKVNLKVFEGIYPTSRNEIVISPQYARTYGIKPKSIISINNIEFIVSGIGGDAYNVYPTINSLDPIPNTRNEFIVYAYPDAFHDQNWFANKNKTDVSLMYFIPWKNITIQAFNTAYFNDYYQKTIFADNHFNDHFQYDYNNYLIEKYIRNDADYQSKYLLDNNLVVTKGNSQFNIYAKGRELLSSILIGFKYFAYIGVFFLILIVIFVTYLIIKKAIKKSQVSMGILKSSGYSTWKIIISYLAYPLITLVIAIPVGWIIGLAVQVYFTEIFNTIFILPYNVVNYNIVPLFISIAVICGFILLTTLVTAYKMLQKKPLLLIKKDNDIVIGAANKIGWLQEKFKNRFKSRFILSLSKTSWKKIVITSTVIAVATLAITATVSVPATINNMKNDYFKTQKYKNYYQYQIPIPNMPLSKYGLYAWNNLNKPNNELFYPTSAEMPWPEDVLINDQQGNKLAWYNPIEYQKTSENTNNFDQIVKFFNTTSGTDRNKIKDQVEKYLLTQENGALDLSFLTWSYSWLGGRMFSNNILKDLVELDKSDNKNFSSSITNFATILLPSIIGVSNPGIAPSSEAIAEILKQVLPGFMRQILDRKGSNAYDYFAIGHNSVAYNPNYNSEVDGSEEELVTQFQLGSIDSTLNDRGFLDVEGINPATKMLVMKSELTQGLKYNSVATVVPMVVNRSFASKFNLSVDDEFKAYPNVKTLYYKTTAGKLAVMPKENWYYGDDPDNSSDIEKKVTWNVSGNKWYARDQKQIKDTDYYSSFGYRYNGVYTENGERDIADQPENWSDINKIWLKLPNGSDGKYDAITSAVYSGTIRASNHEKNLPFKVENIGHQDSDGNWWIKPFSYNIADVNNIPNIDPMDLLLNRLPEWYGAMLDQGNLIVDNSLHIASLNSEIKDMPEWWTAIVGATPIDKYHIIGIQDSYDTPKAYIDQKWANLIAGYSYYDDRSDSKDPTYAPGIYQWFSGKLSASDDIYDIVARMAFKRKADDYSLYALDLLKGNTDEPIVANSDLLLRKKEMLTKMTEIALSASLLFIVTTVICSILIVIMITDAFTDQFRIFMAQMKAEGYLNKEINSFTLGIFTPWAFTGYLVGYGLGFLLVFVFVQAVVKLTGFAFPFSFIWWIIPLSFGIIALIYFSTYIINTYQLNKMDLVSLLKSGE